MGLGRWLLPGFVTANIDLCGQAGAWSVEGDPRHEHTHHQP